MGARAEGIPSSLRCVGNPPRQTEDPMSPPCVPYFMGDNGGSTARGITAHEIRVVVTFDRGSYADEETPEAGIYDVDRPLGPSCRKHIPAVLGRCDHLLVRNVRAYSTYFNSRFQTYGRRVHFYALFTDAPDARSRRLDAAEILETVQPFAVLDEAVFYGHNDEFVSALSARGMMVFSSPYPLADSIYASNDPLAWNFWADARTRADLYSSFVCRTVAPFPVAHTLDPDLVGTPRRFGLYYSSGASDPTAPALVARVKDGLRACDASWIAEATFPGGRFAVDGRDTSMEQSAAVATFRDAGVTTVLWLGGVDTRFTHLAAADGYLPEIVFAGDGDLESQAVSHFQHPLVWRNAWGTTDRIRADRREDTPEYQAYLEGDPNPGEDDAIMGARLYRGQFLLFSAIQLAGPLLKPVRVARALRSLPKAESRGAYDAACFFGTDSHSCVKDAMQIWWDPAGRTSNSTTPGCFRMARGGLRSQMGGWAEADDAFASSDDPCFSYGGTYKVRPL